MTMVKRMIKSPDRSEMIKVGLPGAITPFYKDKTKTHPIGWEPYPGKNYTEYFLFSLRTRVEADPTYASYNAENATDINFRHVYLNGVMRVFLVIEKVGEEDYIKDVVPTEPHRVVTVKPDWIQDITDYHLNRYRDYCVVLTDQYPVSVTNPLPAWWINEMLPRLNIRKILLDSWYDGVENPADDIDSYDYFYENGNIYIRLINPYQDFTGEYTPAVGETLSTGEQVIQREEATYGDYGTFARRYYALQKGIIKTLKDYYRKGVLALENTDPIINRWLLTPLKDEEGLYIPAWQDIRLTSYDGYIPLLRRQMESSAGQWDYLKIFLHIGTNATIQHAIAHVNRSSNRGILTTQNATALFSVSSYSEAVSVADNVSSILDEVQGSSIRRPFVVSSLSSNLNPRETIYYDAVRSQFIKSQMLDAPSNTPANSNTSKTSNISDISKVLEMTSIPSSPVRKPSATSLAREPQNTINPYFTNMKTVAV